MATDRRSSNPNSCDHTSHVVQVELDALPPDVLRALYADAIAEFWNDDAHEAALEREAAERRTLQRGGRQA